MSNEKFSISQLQQLGFRQNASGHWVKDGIQDDNQKSSPPKHQSNECGEPLGQEEDQGPGAESFRYRLIVHSYRTNLIDPSNASMKQIEDCLTPPQGRKKYGLGIIPDDSAEFCDQPLFLQTKVMPGDERTDIEVLRYKVEEESK